ncbi:Protein of unknown function [Lactobacillus delbrueckii subsp. lactis]|nr:Putative uncharacterized protein [Lactobacillus delbrueckii subsp. lactis]CDR81570.1 Protein of unknown function [Lactobacillus delbrueckii subsp. lactis]CDR83164.1 Protein of unknown function [Lactobacillus delbrueckii subsp. lactis]CDR85471.1 Protein of unknown function [Lactobacillus delbrueckii subsp. lactis]
MRILQNKKEAGA